MKQTIKKLSEDISRVLDNNAIANEMGALIDFGEWSCSGPDFSDLVKRWHLTEDNLKGICRIAERYAKRWDQHYPKRNWTPEDFYKYGDPVYRNPWFCILQNLNCIFMSGIFDTNDEDDLDPAGGHGLYSHI